MNESILRVIFRWTHIVFGIPIVGYIYSPFESLPQYASLVRYIFVPVILVSGLWMWKGHVLRRLVRFPNKRTRIQTGRELEA
jgi:hypothetical protein